MTAIRLLAPLLIACVPVQAANLNYSFGIASGWNLEGNSINVPITVNQAFADPALYVSVWTWNAATAKWAFYTPLQADGGAAYAASKGYDFLSTINPGQGFWVNAKAPAAIPQAGGGYLMASYLLSAGWNLVATSSNLGPADFNRSLSGALSGIPANLTTLWAWDSANQAWFFYAPALDLNGTLSGYIASKGYESFSARTLGNGAGFWVNYPAGAPGSVASNGSAFFASLNAMRTSMGIPAFSRNALLDQSASAHAQYLYQNSAYLAPLSGQTDPATGMLYAHSEDPGRPGYLAPTPAARDQASGYSGILYDEVLTFGSPTVQVNEDGQDAFNNLMNTVYHRSGLLKDNLCDIGIGEVLSNFVAEMACAQPQSMPSGALVVFPADGQVDPYPYWEVGLELPNPLPALANGTQIGGPLSVMAPSGHTLVASSFSLSLNGNPVSAQLLSPQSDPAIPANNAFLVPLSPLQLGGATYTATFTGTDNGSPVSKTWNFTTPPNSVNAVPAGPISMKNGQSVAISFSAPSGSGRMSWSYYTPLQGSDIQVVYLSTREVMLTVSSTTLTTPTQINFTVSDAKLGGVPPQTIAITVSP